MGSAIEFDEFVSGCMRLKGAATGVGHGQVDVRAQWMATHLVKFIGEIGAALDNLQRNLVPLHQGSRG